MAGNGWGYADKLASMTVDLSVMEGLVGPWSNLRICALVRMRLFQSSYYMLTSHASYWKMSGMEFC
jgi:hypothetical protein